MNMHQRCCMLRWRGEGTWSLFGNTIFPIPPLWRWNMLKPPADWLWPSLSLQTFKTSLRPRDPKPSPKSFSPSGLLPISFGWSLSFHSPALYTIFALLFPSLFAPILLQFSSLLRGFHHVQASDAACTDLRTTQAYDHWWLAACNSKAQALGTGFQLSLHLRNAFFSPKQYILSLYMMLGLLTL